MSMTVLWVYSINGWKVRTNMPTKDDLILCGCLLDNATYKKFEKICEDMGTTTTEVMTAFVYSVINGDMRKEDEWK